jgi:hypothetical protein
MHRANHRVSRFAGLMRIVPNYSAFRKRNPPERVRLRFFELAVVVVRLDHVARFIVNADHGIM